jgi:hypothetical protein
MKVRLSKRRRPFTLISSAPLPYVPRTSHMGVKGAVHPRTKHEGPQVEYIYSSTRSLTSALNGGEWSMPRPAALPQGKALHPL